MEIFPFSIRRPALLDFARALGSRDNALRRDECGDWRINGSHGHVYAVLEGFQIFVMGWSANGWNRAKRALSFATLRNDGDGEGGFVLSRLPTPFEAEAIRHWVGVAKKRVLNDETRARLCALSVDHRFKPSVRRGKSSQDGQVEAAGRDMAQTGEASPRSAPRPMPGDASFASTVAAAATLTARGRHRGRT